MSDLKLMALDREDLAVVSAHLQDAVLHVGDMAYLKGESRFALVANRFDWREAQDRPKSAAADGFTRRRAGLRIERVQAAQVQGVDLGNKDKVLSLLALSFEPASEPSGFLTLTFSENVAVRLSVECIEVVLEDLGAAWATQHKPDHGA